MPIATVTLSSVGVSNPVALNWIGGGPIAAQVALGSTTMTTDFTVQYTLDDLQLSSSPSWRGYSSAVTAGYSSLAATHYTSASADSGVFLAFAFPVGGLRLNSTAISSNSISLKVLQGESW